MRIPAIDALRGIAILGILFMNIAYHANIELGYVEFEIPPIGDDIMFALNTIFADGRFRTLFCILFGAGLAIQYQSCLRKEIDPKRFLHARLKWLLLFGFIHAVFIFGGDILMLYSLCGLYVVKSLDKDNEALLKSAKLLIFIGAILSLFFAAGFLYSLQFAEPSDFTYRGSEAFMANYEAWYGNYPYQVMVQGGFALMLLLISFVSILWQALGLMYLGIYLYRNDFFTHGFEKKVLNKIILSALVLTALSLLPQFMLENAAGEAVTMLASVSAVFVALLYAHIVIKLINNTKSFVHVFAAAGKVAFSLYILQSIVMGILLRWVMPEFNLEATRVDYFLIVVVFTVVQVFIAKWVLAKYEQGPLEALWRKLYLKTVEKQTARAQVHEQN